MRRIVAPAAVTLLCLAGCSSSPSTPSAAPPSTAHSSAAATDTGAPDSLTGFGATQQSWDAHHVADDGAYNPDPALPKTADGKTGDTYLTVGADNGRIDSYFVEFTPRPTAEALARLKQEFPPDVRFGTPAATSGADGAKCLILTATSATVGKVLGGTAGSRIEVELQSAKPTVLDRDALVSAALVTANKGIAPGC